MFGADARVVSWLPIFPVNKTYPSFTDIIYFREREGSDCLSGRVIVALATRDATFERHDQWCGVKYEKSETTAECKCNGLKS